MKKIGVKYVSTRMSRYMLDALRKNNITLIAVTGSVGKTSARIAISQLLSKKYSIPPINENSYNVPIAIEIDFFGLELPKPLWNGIAWQKNFKIAKKMVENYPNNVVVIELNEDDFDELEGFVAKIHPQIGVITGASPAHMEKLKTIENVIAQTTALRKYVDKVIYNADFDTLKNLSKLKDNLSYGLVKKAKVSFANLARNKGGLIKADLNLAGDNITIQTQHVSKQGLYSLLAAASVGKELGLSSAEIKSGLESIKPVRGRMNLLLAKNGARLIDDSYNSSPAAAISALQTLADIPAKRRIAVLGSMNELGDYSEEGHGLVGQAAVKYVDILVTVGELAGKYIAQAAKNAGMSEDQIKVFRTPYEAGHWLKDYLEKDDLILVKGSQNKVFTEEVSRIVLDDSQDPKKVLVRQSPSWKRIKKKSFRR